MLDSAAKINSPDMVARQRDAYKKGTETPSHYAA